MTEYEFGVGEYRLRGGGIGIVSHEMPAEQQKAKGHTFVRFGVTIIRGDTSPVSWTIGGQVFCDRPSAFDLLPPDEISYRRVPCKWHKTVPRDEYLYPADFVDDCKCGCRIEKITRRGGVPVSVEFVEEES